MRKSRIDRWDENNAEYEKNRLNWQRLRRRKQKDRVWKDRTIRRRIRLHENKFRI